MYEAFYGLNGKPFNLTPDPRFLYLSQKHKEAFAHLVYGVQNRSGFVMVTGEIGTGKTTICRSLLSQLDDKTELAFIFNPMLSPEEMLQKINEEFGIDTTANSVKGLIDELNEYLLDCAARGKNCVLVIDEAQNLDTKLLEQIRLLSNLETETQKLLQILLIGQPELIEKLSLSELRQLNQRITARYHLHGLDLKETKEYIAFRLRVAGGLRKVRFSRGAVRIVYRVAKGTPRVINAICDRALLIGYTQESHQITRQIVRRAAKEIQGEKVRVPRKAGTGGMRPRWAAAATAGAIFAVVGLVIASYLAATGTSPRVAWDALVSQLESTKPIRTADASGTLSATEPAPENPSEAAEPTPVPVETAPEDAEGAAEGAAEGGSEPAAVTLELPAAQAMAKAVPPVETLATPEPEPEKPVDDGLPKVQERWPEGLEPAATLQNALTALLTAWDVTPSVPFPAEPTQDAIAQFAAAHGLSSAFVNPTLDQLLTLNVPALTKVESLSQQVWVGLVASRPESFRLSGTDGALVSIDRERFARHYAKEAVLLWRDPTPNAAPINPWTTGPRVQEFKDVLVSLGFIAVANETYDRETIDIVKRIQRAAGLTVDGIIGPQTRLLLSHWRADDSMPTLSTEPFPDSIRQRVMELLPEVESADGETGSEIARRLDGDRLARNGEVDVSGGQAVP